MLMIYKVAYMEAASIAGDMPIMDRTANKILAAAKLRAATNNLTGSYLRGLHIEVDKTRHGKDRLVVSEDAGGGSVPIEFGYMQIRKSGRRVTARKIPGLRIMRDTYGSIRRA